VKEDQPRPIQSVLTKALNKIDTDDDWASLNAIGNHLNRTDPSFDARNYGFGKLSDLVKAQAFVETKMVTGPGGRGHLWVRLKGRRPVEDESTGKATKKTTKKAAKKATTKTARKVARKA
jgi:OST-HTH/LOTUS domain